MKKFSIILPVYNGGSYFKACVKSILEQSNDNFNLHILDNCSTDGTRQWVESLIDNRIIIYPSGIKLSIEENWGRIKGIAKNEFMTIIGHDDILEPDYLELMDALISKYPRASLYQTHFDYIDGQGRIVRPCLPMDEIQSAHCFLACHMTRTMDSMGSGYLMRSGDFDQLGGFSVDYPNLIFADYQLWIQLTMLSFKATALEKGFRYRLHDSMSKTTNGDLYQQAFGRYVSFIAGVMKDNKDIKMVVERYGHGMLMYFCESLSHRILKTPASKRSILVGQFIANCQEFASLLIPGQPFEPLKKFRIRIAKRLDATLAGRILFKTVKKIFL